MTLQDFFSILVVKLQCADLPERPQYRYPNFRKVIVSHALHLQDVSGRPESEWNRFRSSIQSSWEMILSETKGYITFDEFKEEHALRETLKRFLGYTKFSEKQL